MKLLLRILVSLPVFFIGQKISSQPILGGVPEGIKNKTIKPSVVIEMPDTQLVSKSMKAEIGSLRNKAMVFAYNFNTSIGSEFNGTWQRLKDGEYLWNIAIYSNGAYGLGFVLENFKLQTGEKLFFYNTRGDVQTYTNLNNLKSGILPVAPLAGDIVYIEFKTPYKSIVRGKFKIITVSHAYKNIFMQPPGACNINISCPEGEKWQKEKNGVCKLVIYKSSGTWLCTGSLINNTNQDGTPYILTANHCTSNDYESGRTVFYFNYDSPTCEGIIGNNTHVLNGAAVKSTLYDYDFSLLELYQHPPMSFNPYYLGWTTTTENNKNNASIHHPWGGVKKISLDYDPATTGTYVEAGEPPYQTNGFWVIGNWDKGVTENGSSGGPLLDSMHHIIGTLTGGDALCGYTKNDFFEKFNESFDFKPSPDQQLKAWLDPINAGVSYLDGYEPYPFPHSGCDTVYNIIKNDAITTVRYDYGTGFYGGKNSDSIASYAEMFYNTDSLYINGAVFNIAKCGSIGGITIQVYEGISVPVKLVYEKYVSESQLVAGEGNYIEFYPYLKVFGNYFIGYTIDYSSDTVLISQSADETGMNINTAMLNYNGSWVTYNNFTKSKKNAALNIEASICSTLPTRVKIIKPYNSLKIYPNPAINEVYIQIPGKEKATSVFIYDITGRNIKASIRNQGTTYLVYLNDIPSGMYTVLVKTRTNIYTGKLVKK